MEKFRLVRIIFLFFVILVFCSDAYSQELKKQYYIEKLTLSTASKKSCIYKVFKERVVEDCGSIGFKLGSDEASPASMKYLFLHPLSKEELSEVLYVWTMFYLENDLLVSTRLTKPKEERLIMDGMLSVLEGEEGILESRLKGVEARVVNLNQELSSYLNSDSSDKIIRKIHAEYEEGREADLRDLLKLGPVDSASLKTSNSNLPDIRGELSGQLRDIMEGRVR